MTPPEPPPPPPQIGEQVTGQQANAQAGFHATNLKKATEALDSIRVWSEAFTAAELEALGLPEGTGDEFKSAMAEVVNIANALRTTQFLKKLWGMGV